MKKIILFVCLVMILPTSLSGQDAGKVFDQFVLDNDLLGAGSSVLGIRLTYTKNELEILKREYIKTIELWDSDEGLGDIEYESKVEIYCRECSSYIDIPTTFYNRHWYFYMIVYSLKNTKEKKERLDWLNHLYQIYKTRSDNSRYYRFTYDDKDACERYCNRY